MSARPSLDDYIDVAERIMAFTEKYPDGSLQTLDWSVNDVGGQTFIVYRAAAFRTPDDPRPGHGTAWEPFPGATPYTRNSELMNAETAAWGRAIVAVGLAANRKIASRQEVKARQEEQAAKGNGHVTKEDLASITAAAKGLKTSQIRLALTAIGVNAPEPFEIGVLATVPSEKAAELAKTLAGMERAS